MLCGLGEKERTKIRKKKKEKKEVKGKKGKKRKKKGKKKLMAAESGLVGMKGYLKTYNHMKYFLPVLKPFLTEIAFYAKLAGRFLGSKTKVA